MDHQLRRRALAARLDDLGVDAFLVTDLANTRYLTGFTGSNGQILIGRSFELFLTDGRYAEQARREVPDIELGTAVVPTYPRHPAALAQLRRVTVVDGQRVDFRTLLAASGQGPGPRPW